MPRPRYRPGSVHGALLRRARGRLIVAHYVAARFSLPERWASLLVAQGRVLLNGIPAEAAAAFDFAAGTRVEVRFPDPWPPHMGVDGVGVELDVLDEDEWLIVLNKPPGVVVHPARGHLDGRTLQNAVMRRCGIGPGDPERNIAAPHRLDKDTSGVLLFAKTRAAYRVLTQVFAEGRAEKTYLALVEGAPAFRETVVDAPLGADPANPKRGAVVPVERGGKPSRTELSVLETGKGWALLRARPKTGRAHQVRLHCAHVGLPLAGDRDYHPDPARLGAARQALHAESLMLPHPADGRTLRFEAPRPDDLTTLLARLRREQPANLSM